MPPTSRCLQTALSEEDVIAATREFVASWHPEDLSMLPPECRPGNILGVEDIAAMAWSLAQSRHEAGLAPAALRHLEEMRAFFGEATQRIALIAAWAERGILAQRSTAEA